MSRLELGARFRSAVSALVLALTCSACTISSQYLSVGRNNLHVKTTTNAGELLAATNAWLEIQRVLPGCRGEVEGEVFLRGPLNSLHLPPGRLSNLVFKFRTSSLLTSSSGMTSYTTLIRPREDYAYEAAVTYSGGLFTIDILEIAPQRVSSRKLPRKDITACASA
jgi:hypothetical protein